MTGPIKPDEVIAAKKEQIPDDVFEVVNGLIAQYWCGDRAVVRQDDIITELMNLGYLRSVIFDEHLLDFEEIYEEAGWVVDYDRPTNYESYAATFKFTKKI